MPARIPERPSALGAVPVSGGVWFQVLARHATAVTLCLYASKDASREISRYPLVKDEADLWSVFVPKIAPGILYGYRVDGPWVPKKSFRFNAKKLLLDPYSLAIAGRPDFHKEMLADPDPTSGNGAIDNGATALKSVVIDGRFDWRGDVRPRVPWQDTVVYELHVKGFTQLNADVPASLRGTYAGLAHASVLQYLKDLGVTTVQLLPVHQHLDDGFLLDKGLTNFWGYNSIGFFAPHNEYALATEPDAQVREFKEMVRAFHSAGMEVILDVVYNHTAEGDQRGPMLMFRGFDDRGYYRHDSEEKEANYHNMTGTGNAVDSSSAAGLRLTLDSLRYWVTEMHVDGFRFDLAVTTSRDHKHDFSAQSQFLAAVGQDPILSQVKCIAEPWDIMRMDSYQVGGFPQPWRELNGKYRDTVRRFWAGHDETAAEFAKRLCGSQDIYGWNNRPPLASINFITSHDGFTLLDWSSYSSKHNEANGEGNQDGDNENHSVSCGVEGPTKDAKVNELRARLRRSMIATLACSQGVPFINAGDERGRTQKGNNNAYCQDNEISWVDWSASGTDASLLEFTRKMLAFRRANPCLRRQRFFDGSVQPASGLRDVTWLDGSGNVLTHKTWHDPARCSFGALLEAEPPLLFIFNQGDQNTHFVLPGDVEAVWSVVFDTSLPEPFVKKNSRLCEGGVPYLLRSRAMACLRLSEGVFHFKVV